MTLNKEIKNRNESNQALTRTIISTGHDSDSGDKVERAIRVDE